MPTVTFDRATKSSGDTASATVRVPPTAVPGTQATVYRYATHSTREYHIWPLAVRVF